MEETFMRDIPFLFKVLRKRCKGESTVVKKNELAGRVGIWRSDSMFCFPKNLEQPFRKDNRQ